MIDIRYDRTFENTVVLFNQVLEKWLRSSTSEQPNLDVFPEPVYLKSVKSVLATSNEAYCQFFSNGSQPRGKLASSFLNNTVVEIARSSDQFLFKGVEEIQFRHHCLGPDGLWYEFLTYKRNLLARYDNIQFAIAGLSRPIRYEHSAHQEEPVSAKHAVYRKLSSRDKEICRLVAEGLSTKEIAATLDISTRTVETRRKKILIKFDFGHPVDIVKTLVRFEERGLEKFG